MIAMISYSLSASKRRRQPLIIAVLVLIVLWSWHSTRGPKGIHDAGFYPERYPLAWKHISLASTKGGGTSFNHLFTFATQFGISVVEFPGLQWPR